MGRTQGNIELNKIINIFIKNKIEYKIYHQYVFLLGEGNGSQVFSFSRPMGISWYQVS